MKTTIKETRNEKISNFLENLINENKIDIDINYFTQYNDFNSFDEIFDHLDEQNAFNVDIIYYANAIEYLSKNDPSLQESLSIASELGFTTENLNSELLASLLASQEVRNDFYNLESEITSFHRNPKNMFYLTQLDRTLNILLSI